MVISLRRHRQHDSRREELIQFYEQEYKWSKSLSPTALKPSLFKVTSIIQQSAKSNSNIQIYVANHVTSNRLVVVKLIDLDSEELLDYIGYEINTIKQLRHPNLLPLLCSFVIDQHLWNVTTYARYGSVDVLSKPNGLPELAIAFIVRDVLCALDYLHIRGIIHRAVCGSHILLHSNGNCMLTGMKYSTSVLKDGRWNSTIHDYPKNAVRISNHLAPEILEQNLLGYNSKSDIYSLGIVCCELANGCVPFEDVSLTEMLFDKLTGNFPRPLDSTCEEIRNFPTDVEDLSPEVKEKYDIYQNRTFSTSFHKFAVQLCLNFDSFSRPTAAALITHSFIKQVKKSQTNLLQLLQLNSISSNNLISDQQVGTDQITLDMQQKLVISETQQKEIDVQWKF